MIIGNSVGYPLTNGYGLMQPVDSTGTPFVDKTVVLQVSNYNGYTGSASAHMFGFGQQSVDLTATSPVSAAQSATVRVPATAKWYINVAASTPSFSHSATGAVASSYIYSGEPLVAGVRYLIPSSAPDTITIRVLPSTSTGYMVAYGGLYLPNRYNRVASQVRAGEIWQAPLVVNTAWSANSSVSGMLGRDVGYMSASDAPVYSYFRYCLNANKFKELWFSASGRFQHTKGDFSHDSISALMRKQNPTPIVTYSQAKTTGSGMESFFLSANIPTSVSYGFYDVIGSTVAGNTGYMPGIEWGFTGVTK